MIKKKERRLLFLEAGIFLIIIYLLILGLTLVLDTFRIKELDNQINTYTLKHEAFIAANSFYEVVGQQDCNFSKTYILDEYDELKELSINIASFKNRILRVNEKLHDLKKRDYIIAQAENLNKLKRHNKICPNRIFPIFYFVDGDVIGFNQQSLILQQFAINNKDDIIIYTIDINYKEEPAIKFLIDMYDVKNHNTVVFGELNNIGGGLIDLAPLQRELERQRGQ